MERYRWVSDILNSVAALFRVLIIVALVVFILFHWLYFSNWLSTVTHGEGFGIKFDRAAVDRSVDALVAARKDSGANLDFALASISRAERVLPAINGASVLWVDPHPNNNVFETRVIEDMGIKVQAAVSTKAAADLLKETPFDVVISNVWRPDDDDNPRPPLKLCPLVYSAFPEEPKPPGDLREFNNKQITSPQGGYAMAEYLAQSFPDMFGDTQKPRIIFYSSSNGGLVSNLCARIVTNRPDIMLQTLISALEELRWQKLFAARN